MHLHYTGAVPKAEASRVLPQGILENLTTGLLWLDGGLRLRYLNPAAEILLGLDAHRALGLPISESLPGCGSLLSLFTAALQGGSILTQRELTLSLVEPERAVTVDCTATPVMESEGVTELLVELAPLDRHLRIRGEEALSERSQFNRALARSLAHEIKNPLGGLRGAAQLLARRLEDPQLNEYTRIIIAEADRLDRLVDSLLGPPAGPRPERLNVHELVEHVARLVEAEAPPAVRIARDYDPSLPELAVDRGQIVQALLNLAKNAREAIGARGRILFRTRALRQFTLNNVRHRLVASIEVCDDGPGIPTALQARLFSPLASTKPGGSGLGLALAQELATRHGGLIECSSRPGETVFSLLLPIGASHERGYG